ncbi:MAG TPA: response regulator [Nitrospiraceae bacterium]|nr:response regulator [Nitrospiraceae bacterium]
MHSKRRHCQAHLLLVDDDPVLLEALSGTLQNRLTNFTLDTCETGMKALECVAVKHYDTIISDVNMPGMNGLQFMIRAREVQPQTPVVLLSGHADRALISKAIDAGAADYIAKPIERDMFLRTLKQTLNISRLRFALRHRQANIIRARKHYESIREKLSQSNERWLCTLVQTMMKVSSVNLPPESLMRWENIQQQMNIFGGRATHHLAILDAYLIHATQDHRQTEEDLNMAVESLHRLALTRLQDRP